MAQQVNFVPYQGAIPFYPGIAVSPEIQPWNDNAAAQVLMSLSSQLSLESTSSQQLI